MVKIKHNMDLYNAILNSLCLGALVYIAFAIEEVLQEIKKPR